ncbi:MAG: hypothetical protein GX937_01600 [Lentisphaerae bacterium]|jgi:hypothetical protein|nr:hypothetical protein [Lentisphaerota bacterium]
MESSHSAKDSPAHPSAANVLLVGNSFPLSLVRRAVLIRPSNRKEFHVACVGREIASFWGHANTLAAASAFAGVDLTPRCERPALVLSAEGYPCFDGEEFQECWVLSPDYKVNFRPAVGVEVPADKICGWQILHLSWNFGTPDSEDESHA